MKQDEKKVSKNSLISKMQAFAEKVKIEEVPKNIKIDEKELRKTLHQEQRKKLRIMLMNDDNSFSAFKK
jgi:hypothetical protein